jgi:hypothetical protein
MIYSQNNRGFTVNETSTSTFGFRAGLRSKYDESINRWCPVAYAFEEYWSQMAYKDDVLQVSDLWIFRCAFFW